MSLFRTARRTRPTWLALVVVVMLLAQMLGLVHRVAHGTPAAQAVGAVTVADAHDSDALFGDHDDSSKCRLYDQLTHADLAFGVASTALVHLPQEAAPASHPAWHLAAQAAGYLARGPPIRG